MSTIENILGTVNTTKAHLDKIESKLYAVYTTPNPGFEFYNEQTGKTIQVSGDTDKFKVFKECGFSLGVMGGTFVPMQPREFYDNIISTVHEFGANLDLETLKFKEYCNSKKIEFSVRMKPFTFINNKKVVDETNMEVTFSTSYDGSKSNVISLYTERVVCSNGMVISKLEGTLKGRNTKNGKSKILSYASELAQIINGANEFKEKMQALDKITLKKKDVEVFKHNLLGYNRESLNLENAELLKEDKKVKDNRKKLAILDGLDLAIFKTYKEFEVLPNDYFTTDLFKDDFKAFNENDHIMLTAYEVLQSVTHYTNHIANIQNDADENIRFGQGFKTNSDAQKILFELV